MLARNRVVTPQLKWLLAAGLALAIVWLVYPASTPIYDGIGTDQPYRYVDPPRGAPHVGAPTAATRTLSVAAGRNAADYVNSGEVGPQISIYIPAGALRLSQSADRATLTAVPTAARPPLPSDGKIVTNVYVVTATANVGAVSVVGTGNLAPTLQMRAPSSKQPGPVFEHLQSGQWVRSDTLRIGQDVYQTSAPALLSSWALVQLTHSGATSGGGINVGLLAVGVALLAIAIAMLVIRRRRLR